MPLVYYHTTVFSTEVHSLKCQVTNKQVCTSLWVELKRYSLAGYSTNWKAFTKMYMPGHFQCVSFYYVMCALLVLCYMILSDRSCPACLDVPNISCHISFEYDVGWHVFAKLPEILDWSCWLFVNWLWLNITWFPGVTLFFVLSLSI